MNWTNGKYEIWEDESEGKSDGFIGEREIVLPIESFSNYLENPLVKRLYMTDVGFYPKAGQHYKKRKEGIEEYIFFFCTEGKGTIHVNDKEYILTANEAFCIPRLQRHYYYSDENDPWSILWVHFKGDDTKYYPLEECKIIKFESDYAANRMMFLFELLFRVLGGHYTLGNFIYISQVLSLILSETYTREKKNATGEQNKHITNIIKYMSMHISENMSLDQISEIFGLSKSYINIIFLKNTQHAPMDFYIKLKIREACKLLRSSDLYIFEIAQRVGYNDQYYFSRIFKKVVGVSPKEYRKNDFFFYK